MYSGGCAHLDEWLEIVETGKQKTNKEMKLLVQMVQSALESPDVYVDTSKINDCIGGCKREWYGIELCFR